MQEENTKFFKIEKEKLDDINLPGELMFGFGDSTHQYFFIKADSYLSSSLLEDEDADLDMEYQKILPKLESQSLKLKEVGFSIISFEEFKDAKKAVKESKEKSYLSNLSEDEQFVHEKILNFLEEYDIRNVSQKKFVIALRSDIVSGEEFSEYYLEDRAERRNINIDELFDISFQMVITDFANNTVKELQETKIELARKMKF